MKQAVITAIQNFTLQDSDIPYDFNVEELDPVYKARYIDYAAQAGNLEAIKRLLEKHDASLEQKADAPLTQLFYWTLRCQNKENQQQILDWLIQENRYQLLNCNITPRHIKAIQNTDFIPLPDDENDSLVLSPSFYFITGNKVSDQVKLEFIQTHHQYFTRPLQGYYQGVDYLYLLISENKLINSLSIQDYAICPNLNAKLEHENNPRKGISLAWILANDKKWDLLDKLIGRLPADAFVDLDAKPEHQDNSSKGTSLIKLIIQAKQYTYLNKLAAKANYNIILDQSMIDDLIKDNQLALLLNIFTHTKQKIPVENILCLQKICELAQKPETRQQVLAFLRNYDEAKFNILLNDPSTSDYMCMEQIEALHLLFSLTESVDPFQKYQNELNQLFKFYYSMQNLSLQKEYSLPLSQVLSKLRGDYQNQPDQLAELLHHCPDVIHHVNLNETYFHNAKNLSSLKKIQFEFLKLVPAEFSESNLYLIEVLKENDDLRKQNVDRHTQNAELKKQLEQYKKNENSQPANDNTLLFLGKRKRDQDNQENQQVNERYPESGVS